MRADLGMFQTLKVLVRRGIALCRILTDTACNLPLSLEGCCGGFASSFDFRNIAVRQQAWFR